jgi:hypothetical protein
MNDNNNNKIINTFFTTQDLTTLETEVYRIIPEYGFMQNIREKRVCGPK